MYVSNPHFDTALLLASRLDHAEVVRELLKHENVDVIVKGKHGSASILVASARDHDVEVVCELLVHQHVDPYVRDAWNHISLIIAGGACHVELVRELLTHGYMNVNAKEITAAHPSRGELQRSGGGGLCVVCCRRTIT